MGIRLSGLSSGMDTEALVSALMSSYNLKKDNLVKAQTKLSWKQDSWKTMNASIYNFYTGSLNSAKLSKTYNVKNCTISNSIYAKVSAASNSVNGTQSLVIQKLAATGYLTGGQVKAGASTELTKDTKLKDLVGTAGSITGGSISVTVDGKSSDIQLTEDMSISDVVSKLKSAGLDANYDEKNKRFFVSSKTSGQQHDFSLTANDSAGLVALQTMGLYTNDAKDQAEYQKWANYSDTEIRTMKFNALANDYVSRYNSAANTVKSLEASYTSKDAMIAQRDDYQKALDTFDKYIKIEDGNKVTNPDGSFVYDTDQIEKDGRTTEFKALKRDVADMNSIISKYETAVQTVNDTKDFVSFDGDKAIVPTDTASSEYGKIMNVVDTQPDNSIVKQIQNKVDTAKNMIASAPAASEGSSRVIGTDAVIVLNGATFTNNTNNFTINGLTIQAQAETGTEPVSITTETDVDGVYKAIKTFITDYNTLIKSMDTSYNAASSKGYEPLTSDEKEAMTDDEIKEWEKKIKDSLLRKDATLGNTASAMKTMMLKSYTYNGKSYNLSSFGIGTLGYFTSGDNEKGMLHIDGDADDTNTKGNDDKLREAIANDPESVISFFSSLATDMYSDLTQRMGTTSLSSIYNIYNDKQMATEYSEYKTKISDQESKIKTWEDYYYKKFSKMESALAKLNSNSSSLSNFLGK